MSTPPQTVLAGPARAWLLNFLKEELAPYSGRAATVARMVLAATVVMIICMTFRIPYGFQGAIYALLISRESPRATVQSAGTVLLVTGISTVYILISAGLVIGVPTLHFLWVIGSFFLAFYALGTITNYGAASTFVIMISVAVPLLDRHVSAETNVADILWLSLAASIGVVVTAAVELAFAGLRPGDDIVLPVAERLAAVQNLLTRYVERRLPDDATQKKVITFSVLGCSRLRRAMRRSEYSAQYRTQMGSVVALVGRLVDIAATLTQLRFELSETDRKHLGNVTSAIGVIRTDLVHRRIPGSVQFNPGDEYARRHPLLREIENIITLIPQAFVGSRAIGEYLPDSDDIPQSKFLVPDAFTNPEHLEFALKGCFAASLCYIIYNATAWPGISTAVTTCLLTALSTIGASRQKQVLRIAGTFVGGFPIGMGSQIFILPHLDSITGFTVLFVLVTAFASWFMTCSPRLSYFGLQVALAFYLINLQEFAMQTSLAVARDRVIGVLLGLSMMWLVFDQLWGASAGVEMKRTFVSNLRLLAQLAREPFPGDQKSWRSHALRQMISANFDKVRSLADAVLFEFGSSRQQDLALRSRIRQWQPRLHTLLVTQLALLKYRFELPGFELPESISAAQREFSDQLAVILDGMANRLEGKSTPKKDAFESSFAHLEQTVRSCCSEKQQDSFTAELHAFFALSRSIESQTLSLTKEF